jgi:hypothetical protein
MARDAAAWLDGHQLYARTVTIKVRYSDFTTLTRSHSALPATRDAEDIVRRSLDLLASTEAGRRPVRLPGVSVHTFADVPGEPPAPPEAAAAVRRVSGAGLTCLAGCRASRRDSRRPPAGDPCGGR